jgi:hypothetical protein
VLQHILKQNVELHAQLHAALFDLAVNEFLHFVCQAVKGTASSPRLDHLVECILELFALCKGLLKALPLEVCFVGSLDDLSCLFVSLMLFQGLLNVPLRIYLRLALHRTLLLQRGLCRGTLLWQVALARATVLSPNSLLLQHHVLELVRRRFDWRSKAGVLARWFSQKRLLRTFTLFVQAHWLELQGRTCIRLDWRWWRLTVRRGWLPY